MPALLAAALLWRASRIETIPSLAATAMRVGAGGALVATALSVVVCCALPKLEIEISRISN
jgi:hypothetical protein